MAPVIPNPDHIAPFASEDDFYAWLAAHHDVGKEIWVKMHKKHSGLPSIDHTGAVRAALCWGWIDGIRKSFDDTSFLQRFTPRGTKSIWSQINIGHVERLIAEGRMQPSGLRHIDAAKADGRWDAAYAPASSMQVPDDFVAAVKENPKAYELFQVLNRQNQFAIAFRLGAVKKAETRTRKIAEYVALLARGETLMPNGKGKAK